LSEILSIRQKIIDSLQQAAVKAQTSGKLPQVPLSGILVERPQKPEHGDYATSFPLKLARAAGLKPLAIAEIITGLIPGNPDIADITVAPPGFINFTFSNEWLTHQVDNILFADYTYGNIELGGGKRVQIEFVSVNPTGPLHVGHGRGAILGSALASVLNIAGFAIEKEYYINDTGNQIGAFSRSLFARYQQSLGIDTEMPTEGYFGNYMIELAKEIKDESSIFRNRKPNHRWGR